MSDITLSAGVRANLLSLQDTAQLMTTTQNRLATGKKVNSALDNPLNFFTSSSLNTRASALSGLLDAMSNGIQTIQAANNGLTAITSLVQQLQSTVSQARSDATSAVTATTASATANTSTQANNTLTFDIGGGVNVSINTYTHANAVVSTVTGTSAAVGTDATGATLTVDDGSGSGPQTVTFAAGDNTTTKKLQAINSQLTAAGSTVSAGLDGSGNVVFSNTAGLTTTVTASAAIQTDLGLAATATSTDGSAAVNVALTNAQLVTAINGNSALTGKVSAALDSSNHLVLSNLSTTTAVGLTGYDGTNVTGAATDNTQTIAVATGGGLSTVRQSLLTQFNSLRTQIDKVAGDAGFNGINLLNGDTLNLKFNETNTSSVDISTKDANGNAFAINSTNLGIDAQTSGDFASNTTLDALSTTLSTP